jgi:hypothetical protein
LPENSLPCGIYDLFCQKKKLMTEFDIVEFKKAQPLMYISREI